MAFALIVAPACDDAEGERDSGAAVRAGEKHMCPTWRCGLNAAEVHGRALHELNLDGKLNADGVRVVGAIPPPLWLGYGLDVSGDELVFRKGNATIRGAAIVGGQLLVELPLGLVVPVVIADYAEVPSWAADRPPIGAYTLIYLDPEALLGLTNVCSGSLLDPLASVVTVLGGERYDEATKTVVPGATRWFTLACAGSAAAKLKLLGYGPQSSATTAARRQATLKMITADYCGDGDSHTENGTPIHWANRAGTVAPADSAELGEIEAVWDEHGARCLGATRVAGVEVACELPACAGFELDDGEWVTHVAGP